MDSKCVSYREKIPALALGDLSDADRRELETHFAECPRCRMERESFAQTVRMLASVEDEPAPRHFFITPDDETVSSLRFFFRAAFLRRAAFAGVVVLALLLSGAALSQFHVRVDAEGWAAGFGRGGFDTAAIRDEFLKAAAEDGERNRRQLMEDVRNEIAILKADEDQKTRQLEEMLIRLDSRIDGRVERFEERIIHDTQLLVAILYQELARQRALDMEAVNLRLEIAEIRDFINTRKTEEAFVALLQFMDMSF